MLAQREMAQQLISAVAFVEDPRFVPTLEHSQLPVTPNREVSVPSSGLIGHLHSHSHPDSDMKKILTETLVQRHTLTDIDTDKDTDTNDETDTDRYADTNTDRHRQIQKDANIDTDTNTHKDTDDTDIY